MAVNCHYRRHTPAFLTNFLFRYHIFLIFGLVMEVLAYLNSCSYQECLVIVIAIGYTVYYFMKFIIHT